ncbi:alpha/beta fold hydrolase [Hydrogenophaga intermedia]|uniref:alpha/beta fold hydrolase n=1 Tax=Hydrogenophaga intermedia TaxID=65786 RepID=UPI0020444565|nr:alpha/beta fold hydrolase [Hydrogenophaga intermedia]MCM3562732.1 alpha/beta fold hydrolase [Hydrogenophaga intermedia]
MSAIIPEAFFPSLGIETTAVAGVKALRVGTGPTLLLLHGGTGSWTHWVRNIEPLARHFSVVVPDLPGMGESLDVPADADLDGYGSYLEAAVHGGLVRAGAPFAVAGFSWGGVMAAWLAARLPRQVFAASLLAPGGFPPGAWHRPPLRPVPTGSSDDDADAIHRANLGMMMISDPARIDPLAVAMQRRNHSMTRFKSRFLGYRDTLGPSLARVRCPVLAILPERDPLPQPDTAARAEYLRRMAPQIECRIVPDAGHWVAYEAPGPVNRLLVEFTGRHAPVRTR